MLTVISLFAGCGGSSLGYKMAGFKELLAIDFDKNAVETFKLNFDVPVWQRDLKTVTVQEILNFCNIKIGELDILDGSPPCQGFSTAGKRKVNDDRNDLFKEYARILDGLKPKVFVMENVSGMAKGKMKGRFIEIIKTLKALDYTVKCKLMNAMYYNVPQSRERLIFIGIRKDLGVEPSYPESNNNIISAIQAIKGAVIDDCGKPKGILLNRMKKVRPGSNLGKTEKTTAHFSYVRCPINKPCMTIQKSISFGGITIFHPQEQRNLSIGELKRIASFPDEYKFSGNYELIVNRIGNSVPPLFMKAIAEHIRDTVFDDLKPEQVI
jgi:DNA (cytosine-5)-methyltransferase 1